MSRKNIAARRDYMREYSQKRNRLTKVEVLTHYGGGTLACVTCGEDRIACLSIDHINSDGYRDRKFGRGVNFHRYLQKQGYPEGLQTLCMNCQFIKRDLLKEYRHDLKPDSEMCAPYDPEKNRQNVRRYYWANREKILAKAKTR